MNTSDTERVELGKEDRCHIFERVSEKVFESSVKRGRVLIHDDDRSSGIEGIVHPPEETVLVPNRLKYERSDNDVRFRQVDVFCAIIDVYDIGIIIF